MDISVYSWSLRLLELARCDVGRGRAMSFAFSHQARDPDNRV